MMFDFYANYMVKTREDVDELTWGSGKYAWVRSVVARTLLLNTAFGVKEKFPDHKGRPNILPHSYAKAGDRNPSGLKSIMHSHGLFNESISCNISRLATLGIEAPVDLSLSPEGSFALEFAVTLAQPFISKDDIPFYIIDNPARKDKVFAVPFTSAAGWKGNLRWTFMKTFLEAKIADPEAFAEERFRQVLLFGAEKGLEEGKGWSRYLDEMCPEARDIYQGKLHDHFPPESLQIDVAQLPHSAGMLYFYPTFWDRIDLEVINPHDRETKTGKKPLYFEVVPADAKGFFRLLYVPFYWLTFKNNKTKNFCKEIRQDLQSLAVALEKMMLIYGFSAKKSSGYGVIKDKWDAKGSRLEVKGFLSEKFINFQELQEKVERFGGKHE